MDIPPHVLMLVWSTVGSSPSQGGGNLKVSSLKVLEEGIHPLQGPEKEVEGWKPLP